MEPLARNIGEAGRRRRLALGVAALGAGFVLTAILIGAGAPRGLRAGLFVPFWVGALGLFQARGRT